MVREREGRRSIPGRATSDSANSHVCTVGKHTLVEATALASETAIQRRGGGASEPSSAVHATAPRGVATPASPLPFADVIQRCFGRRDISAVQAHTGGGATVSARAMGADADTPVHAAAAHGTSGAPGPLPYLDVIAPLFGRHDVRGIAAHQDRAAQEGAARMGARAFATGDHVTFGETPTLHTTAHEAAHVIQQRAGVHLKGGVGASGDAYEQHADRVADLVVQGRSAEAELDRMAGPSSPGRADAGAVQMNGQSKMGSGNVPGIDEFVDDFLQTEDFTADEHVGNIMFAYSNHPPDLGTIRQRIIQLQPTPQISAPKIAELTRLVNEAIRVAAIKASVRSGQGAPPRDHRDYQHQAPQGLVPSRLATYMGQVRAYAQSLRDQNKLGDVEDTEVAEQLHALAGQHLLPELVALQAFPALEFGMTSGEAALFRRTTWEIVVMIDLGDLNITFDKVLELGRTMAHEVRHTEQAWCQIAVSTKPRPGFRQNTQQAMIRQVTNNVEVGRKMVGSHAQVSNDQLNDVARRDPRAFGHDGVVQAVRNYVAAFQMAEGAAPTPPSEANLMTYFQAEEHYYRNPREQDAYAVEAMAEAM